MSVAPLALPWATERHARGTSEALGEPAWLLAERMDALAWIAETPSEPNQLFTPYLDLRAVDFDIEPHPPTAGEDGDAQVTVLFESDTLALLDAAAPGVSHPIAVRGAVDYVLAADARAPVLRYGAAAASMAMSRPLRTHATARASLAAVHPRRSAYA